MLIALTRPVSDSLAECELTHLSREPINGARAREQHSAYERALTSLGVEVVQVAPAHDLPDAVFIEDTAVVLDEIAIIGRPGAKSRRRETIAVVAELIRRCITLGFIEGKSPNATLDGGDVLRVGRSLYVGMTARTNEAGIEQLRELTSTWNYTVQPVDVHGCLHLKSAVTALRDDLLLMNPAWLPAHAFPGIQRIEVDPSEPYAANALRIGDTLIYPSHFPKTLARLKARGLKVLTVPCDELAKAEGAVTCCSIMLNVPS